MVARYAGRTPASTMLWCISSTNDPSARTLPLQLLAPLNVCLSPRMHFPRSSGHSRLLPQPSTRQLAGSSATPPPPRAVFGVVTGICGPELRFDPGAS
jgi:hypothetical protein